MNIYVLRHGQTDYNIEGKFQGQIDMKMNDKGEKETDEIASKLKEIHFDAVFCSPLSRTIDTAKKIENEKIIIDNRIIERSFGFLEGQYGIPDFEQKIQEYNIETIGRLISRVNNFLEDILDKYKTNKNLLIVTHEGIAQAINLYFDKNIKNLKEFRLETGKYKKYEL